MSACASVLAALVLLCGADEPDQPEPPALPLTLVLAQQTATPSAPAPYASWAAWRTAPRRARKPSPEPWVEADRLDRAATNAALRAAYGAEEERALRALLEAARGEPDAPVPTTDEAPQPEPEPEPDADTTEPDLEERHDSPPPDSARSVWDRLAECESGNWIDGGSSFEKGSARWYWARPGTEVPPWGTTIHHGGLQFHPSTWAAFRSDHHPQYAYDASREQQIEVAERVLAAQGWGAWPTCARKLGLR